MTEGELVDAGLQYYLNQGSSSVVRDTDQRRKAWFYTTKVAKRLWDSAPYWFRKGDGVITLSSGIGTMPGDFSRMGTTGQVYLKDQLYRPLSYKAPDWMKFQISQSPQLGTPWAYTLYSSTPSIAAQGLQEIICWPQDNSPLDVFAYDKKSTELIDHPLAPFATLNAVAGNLVGTYTYLVTFVTARGETEGGFISNAVTAASQRIALSAIPTFFGRTVTSRNLYRTTGADPTQHLLLGALADNFTTTFADNVVDGSLGAASPGVVGAVSGLELFPEQFHESALFDGLQYLLAQGQGDNRDDQFYLQWNRAVQRQWEEIQQGQNQINAFPPFPGNAGGHSVWSRWSPPA